MLEGGDDGVSVGSTVVDPDFALFPSWPGLGRRAVQFPAAFPGRHEIDSVPGEYSPFGTVRVACQNGPNIVSIKFVRSGVDIEEIADCRKKVDGGAGNVDGLASGDLAGPPENPGYADAAFPRRAFHSPVPARVAAIPRAVVGREKNERVVFYARGSQGFQDLSHRPVELPDDAGVEVGCLAAGLVERF